jgi:hypothetical protein
MINELNRTTRSKSISPKVSLDKEEYNKEETQEKDHFGAPINEIWKDITESVADLYKYITDNLIKVVPESFSDEDRPVVEEVIIF